MSYNGEIEVQSEYKIDDNLPDLMLNIKGNTDDLDEYGYIFTTNKTKYQII